MTYIVTDSDIALIQQTIAKAIHNKHARPYYEEWMAAMLEKEDFKSEDIEHLATDLKLYHKIRPKLSKEDQFLQNLQSRQDIYRLIKPYEAMQAAADEATANHAQDDTEITRLYDQDGLLILIPRTHAAANKYGRGTKWCFVTSDNALFKRYNDQGPLIMVIDKKNQKKYCLHFQEREYSDATDRPVRLQTLFDQYPTLQSVLQPNMRDAMVDDLSFMDYLDDANKPSPEEYAKLCKKAVAENTLELLGVKIDALPTPESYAELCKTAVAQGGFGLEYVEIDALPKKGRAAIYLDLCKKAVAQDGVILRQVKIESLPEQGRAEIYLDLCKTAVAQCGEALNYIKIDALPEQGRDKIYLYLCKTAVAQDWLALQYVKTDSLPEQGRAEIYLDLCKKAVAQNVLALNYIKIDAMPEQGRAEIYLDLYKTAVAQNGWELGHVKIESLPKKGRAEIYLDLCKTTVAQNGGALGHVKIESLPEQGRAEIYLEICKTAVTQDGWALRYVKIDSLPEQGRAEIYLDLCKTAAALNGWALRYVKTDSLPKPSDKSYFEVVKIALTHNKDVKSIIKRDKLSTKSLAAIDGFWESLNSVK